MSQQHHDIDYYLQQSEQWGLTSEVIVSAIKIAQSNPDYSPEVIMDMACDDWDI